MNKFKCFQSILLGFLILIKASTTDSLENEKKPCLSSLSARVEQFPHTVIVKTNLTGKILCRGTLIDLNWILTTPYCVSNIQLNGAILAMGNGFRETIRKPKTMTIEQNNRVALIEIDKPVVVTNTVAPIVLATEYLSLNNECVASGIQKTTNDSVSLVYWDMVVITSKKTPNGLKLRLKDTICRGQLRPSSKIILNGMPLVCSDQLYGMLSMKNKRIFVDISKYEKWIRNVMDSTAESTPDILVESSDVVGTNMVATPNDPESEDTVTVTEEVEEMTSEDLTSDGNDEVTTSSFNVTIDTESTQSDDPSTFLSDEVTESTTPGNSSIHPTVTETTTEAITEAPTKATTEAPTKATTAKFQTTTSSDNSRDNHSNSQAVSHEASLITTLFCIVGYMSFSL